MHQNKTMTHAERINVMLANTVSMQFQDNAWGARHCAAWREPTKLVENAIVSFIEAAAVYADAHKARYESKIGDDGVLGQHWQDIIKGVQGLLNGECGRLDCGTLDKLLCDMLDAEFGE